MIGEGLVEPPRGRRPKPALHEVARRGDPGGSDLDTGGPSFPVCKLVGPEAVAVPGQEDEVCRTCLPSRSVKAFPRPRVAIPGVRIEGQVHAPLPGEDRGCGIGGHRGARRVRDEAKGDDIRNPGPGYGHGVADQPPGLSGRDRGAPGRRQVRLLVRADQSPARGTNRLALEGFGVLPALHLVAPVRIVDLKGPGGVPGLQGAEGGEVAEDVGAPELGAGPARGGITDRHPFVIGLERGLATGGPVALRRGLMVLRTTGPGVVGALVVVPAAQERLGGEHGPGASVGLVLSVAGPVVGQGDDLPSRLVDPPEGPGGLRSPAIASVFIDVVTGMQNHIHRLVHGDGGIGVEVTEGVV